MQLSLQGRDLSRGMTGADVAALHQTLIELGYSIADKELTDKFFGDTTRDNVVDFQKKEKLPPNGVVDAKIAWLMGNNDKEHPNKFIVVGQVNQANGTPLDGATVKAFDKDLRSEQPLGNADTTRRGGIYEIFYRADEFARAEKDRADLIVRVSDNTGKVLATSAIIFNAGKVEIVNLTIGAARGLSEFETIVRDLTPLIEGLKHEQLTADDIAFLNGETQIDATFINMLVESARRNIEAKTVPQSAFYGLFRQGLPTVLTELLQNEISLLRASLEMSSNRGIIAPLPAAELDRIADQLRILKAALILQPGAPGETSSLGDLLRTSALTAEKQRIVAELHIQHGGTTDAFWEAINGRTDFTAAEKNDVRFTLQVGALTTNHIPLVIELRSTAPAGLIVQPKQSSPVAPTALSEDATALRPFAVKNVTDWKTTLQKQVNGQPIGAPPTIPGATAQEKIDNYAVALNAYMEKALPTPVIAARVDKDTAGDNPFNPVKADLRTFFTNNPLYEFKRTPIDSYLSEGRDEKLRGVVNQPALIAELKNMQRLFNIAPRYAEMRSLRKDDVHSALSMVKLGERRFTEKYAATLGGEDKAHEAYRKAQQRHATAMNFYLNYALASNLPSPSVVGNGAMKAAAKTLAATSATPDLPTLFGSLDLCDCSQCQSLYSPAAYFVDILRFLANGPLKNDLTPLQVLFNRRPDLEHIELTCENTSTQLPYVDLTREILEHAVQAREFAIAEGTDISSVLADLNAQKVPASFPALFTGKGYGLTANVSVRRDEFIEGQPRAWLILDSGWAFRLQYLGTGQGFKVEAWPQTSWTTNELRANPEHVHAAAYAKLRTAVYPWDLPLNQPVEEARVYLNHFGVKRQQVMETFFHGASAAPLTEKSIASEYLGLTKQEADIITGNTSSNNPWDFWGLKQIGNDIEDPSDGTAPHAVGNWDVVLQRVSIFLQQSGLSYRDLLELLGSYFINPAAGSGRTLAIVSTDSANPATCNLSRLEIRVVDAGITDKPAALRAAWNRMHRFARLWRKLGWTMREIDKAIVAFQPKTSGNLDLTADFLVQLSHVQRLRAQFNLPVVNLLSFWADIDTGRYFDNFAEGAPPVPTLYAQLFNNKSAAGQALAEDPAKLTGKLSENASTIAAALQVTSDELNLLIADPNIVPEDKLTLANLSRLYRHATFAKALRYSIRNHLSALKLISATPFATTEDTIKFTQHAEKILASGFTIEDLNYLLRHDFSAASNIAITDEAIAVVLSSIRDEVRKITTENSFVEASTDARAATNDPNGDLTKRKLALLNWDTSSIEQLMAVLNGTFTHQADLATLPAITFPESLKSRLSYDTVAKQLRFTGVMSANEKSQLLGLSTDSDYQRAVNALFDAPREIVKRHMGRFSVPAFATPLASLPATVVIPTALKSKIYYDAVAKELNFVGIMTEAERKVLLANEATSPDGQAVQALFNAPNDPKNAPAAADVFLTSSGASNDVSALFDDPATAPSARFIIVLRKLLPYLRATLSERIVIQRLGEYLQLDAKAANDLLTRWVNSPAHPAQKAISEFLAPAFAESNVNVEVSRDAFPDQFKTFLLLYKIALLSLKFRLTAAQMRWLFEFGPGNGWINLNTLPLSTIGAAHPLYQGWARLADVSDLRDALPQGETLLSHVFTSARDATTQLDALLDKISKGSGWKLENLKALSGANGFNFPVTAYKDEVALRRLRAAFILLNQLGASADQCLLWTDSATPDSAEQKCAQDLKSLVRAKLDDAQWLEIAKTLNDPLRERQRAALVSYLTQTRGARNANELYDDFLIDVEMSPCMMTTRIKQAIASVQLFIQRSLMNLEADVSLTSQEAREWAQWRKQYRIWEANRKVLLYPENWIEPELRDGKSPFFKDLENELLQADVTMDTAETAFLHYLEKLQEVARLEIVGMYREREFSGLTPTTDLLHVIGRTFSAPYVYYYRKQINSASWTPWEKVEADVQGDHLIPVIWNRRLYVFWPIFSIKQQDKPITMPATGAPMPAGEKTIEVQLAWTEFKNGKWSPKKLGAPFLSRLRHPDLSITEAVFKFFSFKSRIQNTPEGEQQLFIDCYGPVETLTTITVPVTNTNPVQETLLFTLSSGRRKNVSASVNGGAFQSSDVNKVEIVGRDSQTLEEVLRTRLSSTGTLDLNLPIDMDSVKYYLSSAAYRVEDLDNSYQEQICWYENADTPLIGNGDGPAHALAAGADAIVSPSLATVDAAAPHMLATSTLPRRVCTTITRCEFNLVTVPTTTTTNTVTNPSISPMQAIASFHYDDGQQSVAPLLGSTEISSLQPIVGTRFENMMMVEYENPNNDGLGESRLLQATPGTFRLLGMHQSYLPRALVVPIFFQDEARTYFVTGVSGTAQVRFSTFFHPTVRSFFKSLNRVGINGLLTLPNQLVIDETPAFDLYQPNTTRVDLNAKPREDVDFTYSGAYSLYNWELFFHAPFLIATQLSNNQRFEEAQKWFHYIFNPTATDSPEQSGNPGAERFWRVKPLYREVLQGTQTLEELFANAESLEAQVIEWQANPFKPHVIARLRLVTYMKAVVMRYLDNLIAWGDQLFRRDTIESINEATQLYILAAQILGKRPEQIPARVKTQVQTFRTLDDQGAFNSLANAAVEIEGFLPASTAPVSDGDSEEGGGLPLMPFFGIPGNEKLLGYWTTVADRLFKIRHCMNLEGVARSLPTFEPPIDPGLLVKAVGVGVDVASALSDFNVALPHYRFNVMLQKASELCGDVKALGGALLSALEKRDAEALALLRSTHELKVLKAVRTIKEKQLDEATETRAGLDRTKELTTLRRDYYQNIAFMNEWEITQLALAGASLGFQATEVATHALAGTMFLIPNLKVGAPTSLGVTYGGENVGPSIREFSESVGKVVSLLNSSASMAAIMGGHQRRFDDWKLQERLASKELEQIEKQIAAADIRKAIAEKDLRNHD
ncbi:MAG TPA: neuraminidase-like domain-containing protein, partial [Pyrinomonadaceae bacterium]|nr:neuraminidase-like domain-containing protein [Pyrinomonadaceae bacterium]